MIMPRTFLVIMALIAGLIFFAGTTASFATASWTSTYKKPSSKKPQPKKIKG
jgi:hypothetical protein